MGGSWLGVVNGALRGVTVVGQGVGVFVGRRWGEQQQQGGLGESGDGQEGVETDGSEVGGQDPVVEDGLGT